MKQILITTIAAVVLVGCGNPDGALIQAIDGGNIEAVKQHLANGADVNAKDVLMGMTPLHYAARDGQKEIAELLIAKGAGVNAKNKYGWTPLHNAATGHKEIVELLIAEGADVNTKIEVGGYKGQTPLDIATLPDNPNKNKIADLLRKHGGKTGAELKGGEPVVEATQSEPPTAKAPDIPLWYAAVAGDIDAVKQHLAAGTDVNAKGVIGDTPLHHAASRGRKEIAELLIAKGAAVNAKDEDGETPLDQAQAMISISPPEIKAAIKETADLLRKHGGKTKKELAAEELK